jgi:cell division protein FtsW
VPDRPRQAPPGRRPRPQPARRPPTGAARRRKAPPAPRPVTWYLLLVVVAALVVIGLVMVLSASSVHAQRESGSTWSYFVRQAFATVLGAGALLVTSRLPYARWRRMIPALVVVSVGLLLVVLVPGVGVRVNGARSWIGAGPLRFQPAEIAKLACLLFSADLLARRARRMADPRLTLAPVLVVVGGVVLLMMLQPDLGSTMVLSSIVVAVLFVSGMPLRWIGGVTAAGLLGSVVLALGESYRRARLLAFLDPSRDPMNTGWQINQSLMGVASGGLFGLGLGESRAKWGFLPNAHTDFIFAVIAEELGLIGAMAVVALFVAFGVLGVRAAVRAPDRFGTYVAAGITAWILAQAFVNIGGVVGLLPITGVTLPFVSFGGTSVIITMAAVGILLSVAAAGTDAPGRSPKAPQRRSPSHPAVRAAASR